MGKIIDDNGFWLIKDNPISKAGVYPYLGKHINQELEPDKVYNVLRPIEELSNNETIESFNAVPLINEHEMIGEDFTPYDKRQAGGIIFNPKIDNGVMYADIKIFSEDLKDEINSGKKELSLGYRCNYEISNGVWEGQQYDAIQRSIKGNHIALVDNGRMGKNVRVYDHQITFDAIDAIITNEEKETVNMNEQQLEALAKALANAGISEEQAKIIIASVAEKTSDEGVGAIEEKVVDNKDLNKEEVEDNDDDPKKEDDEPKKTSDEEGNELKKAEAKTETSQDAMPKAIAEIDRRNRLVESLKPLINDFACDGWTAKQVAEYGCKKLKLQAGKGEHEAVLRGYLAAKKQDGARYGIDQAISNAYAEQEDKGTLKYLEGK